MTHLWTFLPLKLQCLLFTLNSLVTDRCDSNYCCHGADDCCFVFSILWAFLYGAMFMWREFEPLWVTDMGKAVSGLGLGVLLCLLHTTLSSYTDTAPISTSTLKAWAVFNCVWAATPQYFRETLFICKRRNPLRCQDGRSAAEHRPLEQLGILHPAHRFTSSTNRVKRA